MPESFSGRNGKPPSWGNLTAPPVWGHGADGTGINKPDFASDQKSAEATTASSKPTAAAVARAAVAPPQAPPPPAPAENVYDPEAFVAKKEDTSVARAAVTGTIRRAAFWFFLTSAIGAVIWLIYRESSSTVAASGAVDCVVFGLIGFFAFRLSRVAFLAALCVYGLGTLVLLAIAFTSSLPMLFFIKPIVVRCGILYKHYRNYGLLTDLHLLENE